MFVASRWKAVSANVPTCPSLDLKGSKEREGEAIPFYAVIAVFVGDISELRIKESQKKIIHANLCVMNGWCIGWLGKTHIR